MRGRLLPRLPPTPAARWRSCSGGAVAAASHAAASPPPPSAEPCVYRATVAYDGAGFVGFQLQPRQLGRTVQGELEAALTRVLLVGRNGGSGDAPGAGLDRRALCLAVSSRTDSGVHAAGNVVSFAAPRGPHARGPASLLLSLNGLLPPDVRVVALRRAPSAAFSARFDALAKTYLYSWACCRVLDPLGRRTAQHVFRPLDVASMAEAAALFEGLHNFGAFTQAPPGRDAPSRDPVRLVTACRVEAQPWPSAGAWLGPGGGAWGGGGEGGGGGCGGGEAHGRLVTLSVTGSGFLFRQVRCMAGALLRVGLGGARPGDVAASLAAAAAAAAAGPAAAASPFAGRWPGLMPAPAHGLCLARVYCAGDAGAPPGCVARYEAAVARHRRGSGGGGGGCFWAEGEEVGEEEEGGGDGDGGGGG